MNLEWKYNGFESEAIYKLRCKKITKQIYLNDGKGHRQLITIDRWNESKFRVGEWIIESSPAGMNCILKLIRKLPADDKLEISFEGWIIPEMGISLQAEDNLVRRYSHVSEILILPNNLLRVTASADTGTDDTKTNPDKDAYTALKEKLQETEKARDIALTKLEENQRTMEVLETALKEELQETREARDSALAEMEKNRQAMKALEKAASTRTEDVLKALQADHSSYNAKLRECLENIESEQTVIGHLTEDYEKADKRIKDLEMRKTELEGKLVSLRSAEENLRLDCDAAARELDGLTIRLGEDEDTLELLQEEPFLKGNSVSETLRQVRLELEAAERRLGVIIRVREKINSMVQSTILTGDGKISLNEELGGNYDGIRSGTEEKNT